MESLKENYKFTSDNVLQFCLDTSCYTREAITATAYTLPSEYTVSINLSTNQEWIVHITSFKQNEPESDLLLAYKKFLQSLIDFQVRDDLERQTTKIREIIVEHAFAPIRET